MTDILNPKEIEVEIQQEKLKIRPLKLKNFGRVLKHVNTIIKLTRKSKDINFLQILTENFDEIVDIIIAGSDREESFVENLSPSESVKLLKAIVEVNADDFLLRMKPEIEGFVQTITEKTEIVSKKK